jgi:hypothetical protein
VSVHFDRSVFEPMYDNDQSINLIQPGFWPCLHRLEFGKCHLEDPAMVMKALLHFTGLEELKMERVGIDGEALALTQPGGWLKLRDLHLKNDPSDDPVGATKGLFHLTGLERLNSEGCGWSGPAISQIKPGDWPHLKELKMSGNNLNDDPVGAMKGQLTALGELILGECGLSGEVISQIKPRDRPYLNELNTCHNTFSDKSVGAINGLQHLTGLTEHSIWRCGWNLEKIGDIHTALVFK